MPTAGQRVGEYVLQERIGQGAFGEVWRAGHHVWEDKPVAIKMPTTPEYVRNLLRDGHAIHGLAHPNIVRAINFDPYSDPPYLVLEYVPGIDLHKLIQRGPLAVDDAASILRQVLRALDHAHSHGVVHRDIKPQNILIHDRAMSEGFDREGVVKVTDFGLGKTAAATAGSIAISASMTGVDAQHVVGTLEYMAPEQKEGGLVDGRADLFSCGVVLFEMLTGKRPVGPDIPSLLNPQVPPRFDEIFRRCCTRVDQRFSSAKELLETLEAPESMVPQPEIRAPRPAQAAPVTQPPPPPPPALVRDAVFKIRRPHPAKHFNSWLAVLILVVLAAGVVVIARYRRSTPPPIASSPKSSVAAGGSPADGGGLAVVPTKVSAAVPLKEITVAMMPKGTGNAYFIACKKGAEEAAAELKVKLIWDGPTSPDPAKQNEIIEGWIARGVDVIAVAVENRDGISPVLRKARDRGIKVITFDSDANPDGRDFFVNQATPQGIGFALMDNAAKVLGGQGEFAIITASLTGGNFDDYRRYLEVDQRRREKYPNIEMVDIEQCDGNQQIAFDKTTAILKAHPKVRLVMAICSPAVPGAAEAVLQSGRTDVKVLGLGLPNENKKYVRAGVTDDIVLWNISDVGYLTVYASQALVRGRLKTGDTTLEAGRLKRLEVQGDNVLLGKPTTFSKDNIDQFDF